MSDGRKSDRRKGYKKVKVERRKGPRRLTCHCGGKIEVSVNKAGVEKFTCARCGRPH